ncbi:MAG: hypothetical protein E7508_01230 [Ruminococcus sp.]|nr:hypothetical protein [Ruminococcus sp.]
MQQIKLSIDTVSYNDKPTGYEAAKINKRLANNIMTIKSKDELKSFLEKVAENGYTFNPATFSDGAMKEDNFEQMQLMVLDFDGNISFDKVKERADFLDLPILFAYDTYSSTNHDRFRVVFLNDVSFNNKLAAKIYKKALLKIFPEADNADKSIAHMYYGGNSRLMHFDDTIPTINLECAIRSMCYCMKEKYGDKHYKEAIRRFAIKNHIELNNKGLPNISVSELTTEYIGTVVSQNGGNMPNTIICNNPIGNNPPFIYTIHLENEDTSNCSVIKSCNKQPRTYFRSNVLKNMESKCILYNEFVSGERRLHHKELFGLANSLINIESGSSVFIKTMSEQSDYYDNNKINKWVYYLNYNKNSNYKPQDCRSFCAYSDKCNHGSNILSTVKLKHGVMEKLGNYNEVYFPIEEMQEDLFSNLNKAVDSYNTYLHVIKAQTSAGKTEAYLRLMAKADKKFLIVVPTNKLKRDVKLRADRMGISTEATPSIDEIKDEIPNHIWNKITELRNTGQHSEVYSYICQAAEKENVVCLKNYLKEITYMEKHEGHTITTHRKFLSMQKTYLDKYDEIIIDEDIILSSIAPNQCEIKISVLKKILSALKKIPKHQKIVNKIQQILKATKKSTMFETPNFTWFYDKENEPIDGISELTDIPALCKAKFFMCRKSNDDSKDSEDSIVFLKPYKFYNRKHIMVSATVDKDICEYCFGKANVKFYECKQAAYTGKLNQYYSKSMSRQCIDEDADILNRIKKWSGFEHTITFKKYGRGDMYFGNAIGCDYLKGQNINVIGTPYQVDFLYKLLPFSFGLDIDENASMKSCVINHNGYRFNFTTYEDEILQKFHIWMIESELEQAVGRARLLRYNCTVNLFSNFPLKQAILHKLENNEIL